MSAWRRPSPLLGADTHKEERMGRKPRKPINPKVKAGAATGVAATALVTVLGAFGVSISAEVALAALTLVAFLAGYFKSA